MYVLRGTVSVPGVFSVQNFKIINKEENKFN